MKGDEKSLAGYLLSVDPGLKRLLKWIRASNRGH